MWQALSLLLLSFVLSATCTVGVDVSQATYITNFKCLADNGFRFAIVRCYRSNGSIDPLCPHTVANAWAGGMSHVDAYFFPNPLGSKSASQQMGEFVDMIKQYNTDIGMVWLDIEGTQYWSKSTATNVKFFNELLTAASAHHDMFTVGIYTSKYQWEPIMGSSTAGAHLPLWYAHYDGKTTFSDFTPFGGWTKPAIKQYKGDQSLCGSGIDENWYP